MTIRIVGDSRIKRVTCPECLSILEYHETEDTRRIQIGEYKFPIQKLAIDCAKCGHEVRL